MVKYNFRVGNLYERKDIAKEIALEKSKQKGGAWMTGYSFQSGAWFILCNIGNAGRTGHDYSNSLEGDSLIWFGRTGSKKSQPKIQELISGQQMVYVFCRRGDREKFQFFGNAKAKEVFDETPVRIRWTFNCDPFLNPDDLTDNTEVGEKYHEGSIKRIAVNSYERNPAARQAAINHYGLSCQVCGFNFMKEYGELGQEFIHVHHKRELSLIKEDYKVDPIKDLIPVCPNCHSMLHRKKPALTVGDLKKLLNK